MKSPRRIAFIGLFLLGLTFPLLADPAPENHPATAICRAYVKAVVAQDWEKCASLILPPALRRKQEQAIAFVKGIHVPADFAARLSAYGVKSVHDLEQLTPERFYVLDRTAVQNQFPDNSESRERQVATLKYEIVASGTEEEGRFVHFLIRTHRQTTQVVLHELTVVSVLQDPADKSKWYVAPDSQAPVSQPLPNTAPK